MNVVEQLVNLGFSITAESGPGVIELHLSSMQFKLFEKEFGSKFYETNPFELYASGITFKFIEKKE